VQLLEKELLEARECIVQRDHSLEDTERNVSELGTQLALALSKQQQLLRQEREMRSSLERASLEKSRMEREVTVRGFQIHYLLSGWRWMVD
jgi:fructose-specific phosphotransferase system component IIB